MVFQSDSKSPPITLSSSNLPQLDSEGDIEGERGGRYNGDQDEGEEDAVGGEGEGEEQDEGSEEEGSEGTSWSQSSATHSSASSAVSACSAGALARAAGETRAHEDTLAATAVRRDCDKI